MASYIGFEISLAPVQADIRTAYPAGFKRNDNLSGTGDRIGHFFNNSFARANVLYSKHYV
jgi:hypothetical protein